MAYQITKDLRKHPRYNSMDLVDRIVEKCPFRIIGAATYNGHEFQTNIHWHIKNLRMGHANSHPRTPRLNTKVEAPT